jgi:hypothetical protein
MTLGANPFVTSAPLIVAAVCSDGVALIALHTAFPEEPLLLDADEGAEDSDDEEGLVETHQVESSSVSEGTENDKNGDNSTISQHNTTVQIKDMPRSYRGPFRIYSIDGFGTGMVCAGWRSHGQLLADYCRDLAKEELQVYGPPRMTSSTTSCPEYGHYLATQTSAWMAYTAVLRRHPWSCVGLLATCSSSSSGKPSSSDSSSGGGCLWLIDATGAYRVRAHAVGGGPLAGLVNQYLARRLLQQQEVSDSDEGGERPPLPSAEELLRDVLEFLSQQHAIVLSGTRAELAVIGPGNSSMGKTSLKRVFTSRLFGVKSSTTSSA